MFGKKSAGEKFDQDSAYTRASDFLAKQRSCGVQLAFRGKFETPFLTNRWQRKDIEMMLSKMVGKDLAKTFKDLTNDFEGSYYRDIHGTPIVPCRMIKAAIVNGAITTNKLVTGKAIKRELRVLGSTAKITAPPGVPPYVMDIKTVRVGNGAPDIRARAIFPIASTFDFVVQFASGGELSPDKVIAAIEGAGAKIGLGEWRLENGGEYGSFSIELLPKENVEEIIKAASIPEEELQIAPEFLRALNTMPEKQRGEKDEVPDPARKVKALLSEVNDQHARANGHTNGKAFSLPEGLFDSDTKKTNGKRKEKST